jgi:GTP-binding protein
MITFVDRVRIFAKAGDGGRGCVSFRREPHVPLGGPDGGKGGKGGNIVLRVNPHLNNLYHLKLSPHHRAENGKHGGSANCTGKNGRDTVIEVPCGTVVSLLSSYSSSEEVRNEPLAPLPPPGTQLPVVVDLMNPGEEFILCQGGRGGRGNESYKSSTNQAPREYEEGYPGEAGQFVLELKSIADVGLVGYPNAGKSSLLAAISHAHPKIAPYPFSTLQPMVGVVEHHDFQRMTVADIPGLIEGAHKGMGLGHDFLRHIDRCRVLIIVLDAGGTEGRDPLDDYAALRKELKLYSEALAKKKFLVAANKADLPEARENIKRLRRKIRRPIYPISTLTKEGIHNLLVDVRALLDQDTSASINN